MAFKIIISALLGGVFVPYLMFCMFLNCVALPSENKTNFKYEFKEQSKGFIKFSRILGCIFICAFILLIMTSWSYLAIFGD